MLIRITTKYGAAQIMEYLKGKSSLMLYEKYANMKYKNRQLSVSVKRSYS